MENVKAVTTDAAIHHGTPVISGTRIPVSIIVGSLGGGMTQEEVMSEYGVSKEQVEAALTYAAELVAQISIVPLAG